MEKKYRIMKQFKFEAAHRLEHMPQGHQCANLHGHSYKVDVEISASVLDEPQGFVLDYGLIGKVKDTFDHKCLNDIMPNNPTAEHLADFIFDILSQLLFDVGAVGPQGCTIERVRVHETDTTWAEVVVS